MPDNSGPLRVLYYSSNWEGLEERVGSNVADQYVWSPVYIDALIERDGPTAGNGTLDERLYVQQDGNWNVTAEVSTGGSVLEREVYDPYGTATFLTASFGSQSGSNYAWIYLHQGGRFEITSGLYDFRNRELSAAQGRWTTLDSAGFGAGDVNLYRSHRNNTVNALDPLGLKVTGITVIPKRVHKSDWVAFVWPANFKLEGLVDGCLGGWVIQHIIAKKVKDTGDKEKTVTSLDYWEGFRVPPPPAGKNRPKLLSPKDVIDYFDSLRPHIDLSNITANDWYWNV